MRNNYYFMLLFVAFLTTFISINTAIKVAKSSGNVKSNSIVKSNGGIYFSDIPLNDAEGSAAGSDDDLDDNASGKGDDDEDSKDTVDKEGSGDTPNGNELELGSGEDEPLFISSSTERPTKKPELTKKPTVLYYDKEPRKKETSDDPLLGVINENNVPQEVVPQSVTSETTTKLIITSTTLRTKINEFDVEDNNKMSNEVSIMGQKQVTPASFFARPGILAAVIGGAVVGLLCAILLVMFIVYRMRKKDEGSYSLDEPKRSTSANPYARGANKEFYA